VTIPTANVVLDPQHHRGRIDRRLFGSFVEHLGRGVYTGVYEPGHPTADAHGFRGDVADLVDELGVTVLRYPGGNFVSGYDWRDGIGPIAGRPRRIDGAWRAIETNEVGTDEFLQWAGRRKIATMMAVNLGTAGITEAANLVEYCNVDGGTYWSDLRREHGVLDPHGVSLWCLGNEMDGFWQIGHKDADHYAALAAEAGKAMKLIDPTIELVVCGSSWYLEPTFGYWESTVLERCWEIVDYISMHGYYQEYDGDRQSFLASGANMDTYIEGVAATIDAVAARKRSRKRIGISFDEWNVWYQDRDPSPTGRALDIAGPRLENIYSKLDAVVVGDLLSSLINHSDRVRVACQAQLVNVIAPIMTEPGGSAWRQSIYYPMALTAARARGNSLRPLVAADVLATRRYGEVPALAVAATHDQETDEVAVFLTNRADTEVDVAVDCRAFGACSVEKAVVIAADGGGPLARDAAAAAAPGPLTAIADGGCVSVTVPAASWSALVLRTTATTSSLP
jgi:alpha-N-arabinofuranosidase